MASLIYTNAYNIPGVIEFDATMAETHNVAANVTEHPVEVGVPITDHVRGQPLRVSLEGMITNTPLVQTSVFDAYPVEPIIGGPMPLVLQHSTSKQVSTAQVAGGNASPFRVNGFPRPFVPAVATPGLRITVPKTTAGQSIQFPGATDRVTACFNELLRLCSEGVPIHLITKLKDYGPDRMVITSVSAPVTANDAIVFGIELTEVRYAETRVVGITKRKATAKKSAQPTTSEGVSAPKYVEDTEGEDLASTAVHAGEYLQSTGRYAQSGG